MIQQVLLLSCFRHNHQTTISAAIGVFFEEGTQESPWPLDSKQPEWELVVMIFLKGWIHPDATRDMKRCCIRYLSMIWVLDLGCPRLVNYKLHKPPFWDAEDKVSNLANIVPYYPSKLRSSVNSQSEHFFNWLQNGSTIGLRLLCNSNHYSRP